MNAAARSLKRTGQWLTLASLLFAGSASPQEDPRGPFAQTEDTGMANQVTAQATCTGWNLATEFRLSPDQANPNPDNCGNADVWHFMESSTLVHDPLTYSLLSEFIIDAFFVPGLQQWQDPSHCSTSCNDKLPALFPLDGPHTIGC